MKESNTFYLFVFVAVLACASGLTPGKFWHVTDFHYDHTYWTDQLSCNDVVPNPGNLGDYWCDSPWRLITAAIDAMKTHNPDVDFLLWTGDTVAHIKDDNLTLILNMEVLGNITNALSNAFPSKTVYATFGNHDYWPSDQFPNFNNEIYNRTATMWQQWINEPQQMDNFRKGGYYTRTTGTGLRILALNTNLYYTSNKQTPGIADPSDQLKWARTVLENARNNNEKVLVTAHIPPGVVTPGKTVWFQSEFVQPVNSIFMDFADVIVGMHFGHDHMDGFKIFPDKQGKASFPLLVAPSVTPWRYKLPTGVTGAPHNPSVRLVTYDRDTGKHLNLEQFHLDLPYANRTGDANFTLLYSFTQHYGVQDLSADSLVKLVKRMGTGSEGDKLLDDYVRFIVSGANVTGISSCDQTCKYNILCGFEHHTLQELNDCVKGYSSGAATTSPQLSTAILVLVNLAAMLLAFVAT